MANPQHVEWLKEGVEAWNSRRLRFPFRATRKGGLYTPPSLQGASLEGLNFQRINLNEAGLGAANLRSVNLTRATLSEAYLFKADFTDAILQGTNLEDSDLNGAILERAIVTTKKLPRETSENRVPFVLDGIETTSGETEIGGQFKISSETTKFLVTDLSKVKNLTQKQVNSMIGTRGEFGTILPRHLTAPEHWDFLTANYIPEIELEPDNADERVRPWYPTAQQTLAPVTPIADVAWTPTGELNAQNLTPITPTPRKAVPIPSPEALVEIKRGLHGLCQQLRTQLASSFSPNAAAFIGDADHLFGAIETQLERPDTEIIPLLVQVNLTALERLSPSAEALADTEEVIFNAFIEQGHKYLKMLPVLRLINDPYNEDMIPDDKVDDALDGLAKIDALLDQPDIVAQIGPKLGGVTRESDGFPWESDKQKIANKTAMWMQVLDKLENPPQAIKGAETYMAVVTPLILAIVWLMALLFG